MRLGVTVLSGVIFLALTIAATVVVYEAGMPVMKKAQAAAVIEKMKDVFTELDSVIRQVASEGEGSKRTVYMTIDSGKFVVNSSNDAVYWTFNTEAQIISPRTAQRFGNVMIGSNLDTQAQEENYTQGGTPIPCWVIENEHLKVYVRKLGSPGSPVSYNTTDLLVAVYQKGLGTWLNNTGLLEVSIDDRAESITGSGWTSLEKSGHYLPYGTVASYINSSYVAYWINMTLESGMDFLIIGAGLA